MTYHSTCDGVTSKRSANHSSFVSQILNGLRQKLSDGLAAYRAKRQARIDRAAFQQMLLLEDDILDDIGVTRADVEWASQLPIHQSAGLALEALKKRARPKIRP